MDVQRRGAALLGLAALWMVVFGGIFAIPSEGAKPYTIKVAYVVPETQSTHLAAVEVFKPYVERASQGKIRVELYPNGSLGGDRQTIESVQLGTIEMTIPAVAVLSGFEPKFQIFDLPFLFKSKEAAYRALDGELGNTLEKSRTHGNVQVPWSKSHTHKLWRTLHRTPATYGGRRGKPHSSGVLLQVL